MLIYKVEAPDGNIYRIEGEEGATPEQLASALYAQVPEASNPPKNTSAGFSLSDLGRAAGSGVAGGLQALAGVAGANNPVSNYLGDVSKNLQEGLSPERKAEMQARQAKIAAAEKTGSIWEQVKAGAGAVAEAPLQSLATGAGSMVTPLAAGAAAIALAPEALVGYVGANVLSRIAIGTVGAAMGSGQSKQDIFNRVKKEYMDAKVPEAEAEKKAMLAQNWVGKNIDQIAINAGTGALEAATGVGRVLAPGKAAVKAAFKAPSLLKTVGAVGLEEAASEVAQSLSGTAATNVAASREGFEAPTFQGAAAPAAESGLTAFLLGSAAGPKEYLGKRGEYEVKQRALDQQRAADETADAPQPPDITSPAYLQQIQTQYQEAEKRKADLRSQLRKIQEGSGTETADRLHNKEIVDQIKAMNPELERLAAEYNKAAKVAPAFTPEAPEAVVVPPAVPATPVAPKQTLTVGDALDNPLGKFTKEELSSRSPKVVDYIDKQRKKLGKPALNDYSIEDIRDAMPGQLPDAEKADLNSLIAAKTGYTPDVTYKPDDIINVAKQKNIATDTDGFKLFLQRATGDNDLTVMEQPQLHSAFKSLSELPQFEETQYLPEKTSATHYSPEQYIKAVESVSSLASEKDIPSAQALQAAKKATGLTRDSDVQVLLQSAYTNGDLNLSSEGNFIKVQPTEQAEFRVEEGFAPAEPTGFNVMRGDQLLYSTQNQDEANAKVESLSKTADPAMKQIDKSIASERSTVAASQRSLDIMEAGGMFRTPKYQQASAQHAALVEKSTDNIQRLQEKKAYLQQPVTIRSTGKPANVKVYRAKEQGVSDKAFNTREETLKYILENLPAARLNDLAGKSKAPGFAKRLQAEVERRKNPPKQFVATQPKVAAKVETKKPEATAEKEALKSNLLPMLKKFGLGDVALQIEAGMKAEGSYTASVIKVALDANNPVRVLRHESIHGLKDLGFFTPGQWKVLENQANKVWIDKYLKERNINGQPIKEGQQSRYEAYQNLYDGDMDAIREEAIADAFGDFDVNGVPKGLFATLLQKMQDFFRALRSAFTGAGYETADDVFGKVERGELKATKVASAGKKASVRTITDEVPLSTRRIVESNKTFAQNELGLSTTKKKGATGENTVREVANALNKKTLNEFGKIDRNDHSKSASDKLADAIADEVGYQLRATSTTGTGAGWYSNNYPKALKRLATRFPELESNPHARSVFSALVAITSNGERVDQNISNAIKLYSKLRDGKPLVAMGVRRATALDNNLSSLQDLLQQYGTDFEKEMTKEITVRDLNAYLRSKGEKADNSYLAETKIPAAAIHFGPKLGAFFSNLSGSEGYLTMDLWWTRSINRMRGQLMPQATESSISKFREMMDKPDATRDEVVAATIPFRNNYKNYGYETELEYLAKSKEPTTTAGTEAWFKKAKRAAGDVYPQLEFDHKMEKMANTIYKGEYEMLAEAPFGASDRQFMYDSARKAQTILANQGINLTLADIQAALWYYEKRLYAKLTGREADDIGYEEAIVAQSKNGNGRARPSVVFSGQPDGRNVTAGEVDVLDKRSRGDDLGEKQSLRSAEPTVRSSLGGREVLAGSGGDRVSFVGPAATGQEAKENDIRRDRTTGKRPNVEVKQGDGRGFTGFFSNISLGFKGKPNAKPYEPTLDVEPIAEFVREYNNHRGNFDDHIATSIPGFREVQTIVGNAIAKTYKNADMLDIGASEGALIKAITQMSDGNVRTVALDPNFAMAKHFNNGEKVEGSVYNTSAFGTKADEGQLAWAEDETLTDRDGQVTVNPFAGKQVRWFKSDRQFDVIHEAMVFQFISGNRASQIARTKELMKPNGVLIIEEKFVAGDKLTPEQFRANEMQKDAYKEQYFTKAEIEAKAKAVGVAEITAFKESQEKKEQTVTGMNDLMVSPGAIEYILSDNFDHVAQFWDSGNFKGYIASDSPEAVERLLKNMLPTDSEFANVKTPRAVSQSAPAGKGIVLGTLQAEAVEFSGVHYGNVQTSKLEGGKHGTGLRGAERRRLQNTDDARIKNRVYFYIEKPDGAMPIPESGVGHHVYTQVFKNILGPGKEMSRLFSKARGDSNSFESNVVDAGYDGYAVPSMGMMVILNHNVPVNYEGTRPEYDAKKPKLSLREFQKDDLPKNKQTYTIPANTVLFHGSHKTQAELIEAAGRVLRSRPDVKASGGGTNEGGLIFFGERATAEQWSQNQGDPLSVRFDREAGIAREAGTAFQTITDRPYRLMKKQYELSAKEAAKVTEALGLPEYKSLSAGDSASLAANRADNFSNSNAPRYTVMRSDHEQQMSAPWPIIFDALGVDGYFDDFGVAISAENGIRLEGNDGKMERFSLRTNVTEDINNLPNGAAINAAINRVTTARQEVGYAERMTTALAGRAESFSYFRQKFFDRYNRLNDVERQIAQQMGGVARLADQSAHAAALQSDAAAGVAASALGVGNRIGGMPVYRNGYTTVSNENGTVKGAVEIFSPLAKYGDPKIYQAYQFWAGAKRGKRLMASGKEELYTPQDMALAKQLEQQYPEFADVQKDWIKYNDGLVKYAVDTGVISSKNAAEFTRYSDYVPFYRQLEGERTVGPNIFQSISGVKAPKKLTGSEAPLADFLETVVRNTQSIIQAGMKNVAAQKAVEGGMMLQMVRKMDHLSSGPNVVTILKNGEKVSYECADKLWVDAVSSLNLPELPFLNFLAAPANLLRNLVTKDPGFMLANLMRDSVSAYVTSGAKLTPVASAVKEFGNVLMNNSPEYQKLLSAGVLGGYEFSRNVESSAEAFGKDLRKKTGTKTGFETATSPLTFFWDALEKGTEASDAATRIAVYKATLAETGNEAEAIHRALEVMNFNRKGSSVIVRVAAATIPFLNARVQGLDVFFRSGIRPFMDANPTEREKQVQKAMLIRGMTILGFSVMYAAAISGNPDYEKQEEETKDNNWIIPMGEGKNPLKIPIPFEVGTLFKTIPERIYRSFFMPDKENRDTTDDLHKSMKRALLSTLGFNPVPQVVAPLLEARDNFSVFTQRPIVGQNMQSIAPEFQVGPGTSKWAEILGKQAGMSPMMIDHVYKGYTGTMGVYAADLLDAAIESAIPSDVQKPSKRFEQMPIIKRFLADPEARGQITSYFDLKHSVDTTVRTINLLEKNADPNLPDYVEKNAQLFAARDFMNNLNKQMDDLQKQANMIKAAPIPADEKRDMLTEITKAQNLLVNDIRQIRNLIKP